MLLAILFALAAPAEAANVNCVAPGIASHTGTAAFLTAFEPVAEEAEANIREGFRRACAEGLRYEEIVITDPERPPYLLHLHNSPEGNVATLAEDLLTSGERWLVLEYPFVASDGSVNVPSPEEIHEAIYCAIRGATEQEQQESGRCLPD